MRYHRKLGPDRSPNPDESPEKLCRAPASRGCKVVAALAPPRRVAGGRGNVSLLRWDGPLTRAKAGAWPRTEVTKRYPCHPAVLSAIRVDERITGVS
jgi:hypothetical protein